MLEATPFWFLQKEQPESSSCLLRPKLNVAQQWNDPPSQPSKGCPTCLPSSAWRLCTWLLGFPQDTGHVLYHVTKQKVECKSEYWEQRWGQVWKIQCHNEVPCHFWISNYLQTHYKKTPDMSEAIKSRNTWSMNIPLSIPGFILSESGTFRFPLPPMRNLLIQDQLLDCLKTEDTNKFY